MNNDIKQITQEVSDVTSFIVDNSLHPELEVRMKRSIWGAGSRPTIYEAMKVQNWSDASLTEKVILYEAWQMMKEMATQTVAA